MLIKSPCPLYLHIDANGFLFKMTEYPAPRKIEHRVPCALKSDTKGSMWRVWSENVLDFTEYVDQQQACV